MAAIAALAVDLASKALVFDSLGGVPPDRVYTDANVIWLLPGAFRLICHYNLGGAFGVAAGQIWLFLGATAVLVPALVYMAYHTREPGAPVWSLGMVVGGAIGNLYDRLLHPGVRDFLDILNPFTGRSLWPVFNIADVAIVLGVAVYLAWSLWDSLRKKSVPAGDAEEEQRETYS